MRAPDTWLDRFAARHPRLGIPRLMLYIVIGNLIVFCFDLFSAGTFSGFLGFHSGAILHGQLWRLVTFIFVPLYSGMGGIFFFALTLYFYYFIGSVLEGEWGTAKFTLFYFIGVLFNIAVGFVVGGASMHYVNLSMFFAFATLYPDMQLLLFFFIPVKVKWLAVLDAVLFALDMAEMALAGEYLLMLLPVVAILNYFLFFWSYLADHLSRNRARAKHQQSQAAVNFRKAQQKAKETKGYMHKCSVCGVTDADDPNMEFRYCSKCDGYYCYCMEHINDHVHVRDGQ